VQVATPLEKKQTIDKEQWKGSSRPKAGHGRPVGLIAIQDML